MEQMTRRAAMGMAAVGAVALAATGTAEAMPTDLTYLPKFWGRMVTVSGDAGNLLFVFEDESGTVRVVKLYLGASQGLSVLKTYARS